ncbi:MAG: OmpA family protein [Nitrospirales bacterium]|nr:OmpA family protein [Nitrospirales bacterium]
MRSQKTIIIKKVKKNDHGGSHGGSWKVAYADFVTAMMAFFLLLWLITMVAPEKKARVSSYFKSFTIFEKAGSSSMFDNPGAVAGDSGGSFGKVEKDLGKGVTDTMASPGKNNPSPESVKKGLKKDIEAKLADVKDQILVDVFEGGVRIQITDKDGQTMFPLGDSALTPQAKKILEVIAGNVKGMNNKIAIEGHTDALSYATNKYTNWELSTERASAARKELEQNGLSPDRLSRVAGYAATDPLIKENPNDPRNRRISIILLFPPAGDSVGPDRQGA